MARSSGGFVLERYADCVGETLNGPNAPYVQIAGILRSEILSGTYDEAGKLPPSRKLIERFGVTAQPINNAVRLLREEGLVTTSQQGAFVVPASDRSAAEAGKTERDALTRLEAAVFRLEQRVAALESERDQQSK